MVIAISNRRARALGALTTELLVAIAILSATLLPFAYSVSTERRLARAYYQRAVAMEIVDGEMEALAAGQWRQFNTGVHDFKVTAAAARNLPPGRFVLTLRTNLLRLEWRPTLKDHGGAVTREISLPERAIRLRTMESGSQIKK